MEKMLRQNLLTSKYQSLLSQCLMSNPVSAKMAFDARNEESDIQLAVLPYSSIKDSEVEPTDADLKAKYGELKEMFHQYTESRDIKYVDFQVVASKADRDGLMKTMKDAQQQLEAGQVPAEVVRKAQSQVPYTGLAVTRSALPSDIAAKVDSMQVGQITAPFETVYDNTYNVVKLVAKAQLPDSIEFRAIQVGGATPDEAHKRADSIYTALKDGADFEALAKKYGQTAEKQWMTSQMYERSQTIDADSKNYIETLNTLQPNELKNVEFTNGNIVVQVTDRKAIVTKYDVAIIKHTIDFSKGTYSDAYNKFSQYVSENQSAQGLEEHAADYGFNVISRTMNSTAHNIANIHGTHDALKWLFDEAKPGQVSQVYDRCGNNDQLVVVALDKVNPAGYQSLDAVKDALKREVMNDKKFATLAEKLKGVNSIAAAQQAGAKVDTVKFITFSSPVFVQAVGQPEPALSGAITKAQKGQFVEGVKGNAGVYAFQVIGENNTGAKLDDAAKQTTQQQIVSQQMRASSRFMQELAQKAKVQDNRYLFY